jgi:hypothetical protein
LRGGESFAGRCEGMFDLRQARLSDIIRMLGDRSLRQLLAKETPADDPRQKTDGSLKQTDKPWKGPPEQEQKPSDHTPDPEKWQETRTH